MVLAPVFSGVYGVYSLVCYGDGRPFVSVESCVESDEPPGLEFGACLLYLPGLVIHRFEQYLAGDVARVVGVFGQVVHQQLKYVGVNFLKGHFS